MTLALYQDRELWPWVRAFYVSIIFRRLQVWRRHRRLAQIKICTTRISNSISSTLIHFHHKNNNRKQYTVMTGTWKDVVQEDVPQLHFLLQFSLIYNVYIKLEQITSKYGRGAHRKPPTTPSTDYKRIEATGRNFKLRSVLLPAMELICWHKCST